MDEVIPDWAIPGATFRVFPPSNRNTKRYHVRGIVDGHAVVRRWLHHKRYWHYEVLEPEWFNAHGPHIYAVKAPVP